MEVGTRLPHAETVALKEYGGGPVEDDHCLHRHEEGQDLVEYSMLILIIALVVIVAIGEFGVALADYWQGTIDQLGTLLS